MKFNLYYDQTEQDHLDPYNRILLVESDPAFRGSFFDAFHSAGLDVHHFFDMESAMSFWEENTGLIAVLEEEKLYRDGVFFCDTSTREMPGA